MAEAMAFTRTRCCHVCHVSASQVVCVRCHVVFYCSAEHQNEDAPFHKPRCNVLLRQLRQCNPIDISTRADLQPLLGNLYLSSDTHYWLFKKKCVAFAYNAINTHESLEMALRESLELLVLSHQDPLDIRDLVATLYLRFGRLQSCYDLLKWYALSGFHRRNARLRGTTRPFLNIHDADLTESLLYATYHPRLLTLSDSVALVVTKMHVQRLLWEGVQAKRLATANGLALHLRELIQQFLGTPALPPNEPIRVVLRAVREQALDMIQRVHHRDCQFWRTVLLSKTPQVRVEGGSSSHDSSVETMWRGIVNTTPGLRAAVRERVLRLKS